MLYKGPPRLKQLDLGLRTLQKISPFTCRLFGRSSFGGQAKFPHQHGDLFESPVRHGDVQVLAWGSPVIESTGQPLALQLTPALHVDFNLADQHCDQVEIDMVSLSIQFIQAFRNLGYESGATPMLRMNQPIRHWCRLVSLLCGGAGCCVHDV